MAVAALHTERLQTLHRLQQLRLRDVGRQHLRFSWLAGAAAAGAPRAAACAPEATITPPAASVAQKTRRIGRAFIMGRRFT
jgi:hypothetical protein